METLLESFREIVHSGDPIFREWFLLKDFTPVLVIASCYVLFVKFVGPAHMSNRKPIKPVSLIFLYNMALVFFYLSFLYRGVLYIPKLGFSFFCGSLDPRQGPHVVKFFELGHELYMVKFIELFDTVFLVLSKKFNMITNLHVFHHAVVPIFGFIGFRSETNTYLTVYMGMNAIIHVIMYIYYGIAILGPQYQKYLWWKKYLTSLQILQFFLITIYIGIMSALGCTPSKTTLGFCITITVLFFFLFLNYYRSTFVKPSLQGHASSNGDPRGKVAKKTMQGGIFSIPTSDVTRVNRKNGLEEIEKQTEVNNNNMRSREKNQ